MISILYDIFKKWSAKGSVYIISDPHFSDAESFELVIMIEVLTIIKEQQLISLI